MEVGSRGDVPAIYGYSRTSIPIIFLRIRKKKEKKIFFLKKKIVGVEKNSLKLFVSPRISKVVFFLLFCFFFCFFFFSVFLFFFFTCFFFYFSVFSSLFILFFSFLFSFFSFSLFILLFYVLSFQNTLTKCTVFARKAKFSQGASRKSANY